MAFFTFNAQLAQKIYAGSDIFLMPSRFEPCGLSQMIALRYGSIPIVRDTGGLADTVQDGVTGFTFHDYQAGALWNALQRAAHVYNASPSAWREMQLAGMSNDFSWKRSAEGYQQMYEWAIAQKRFGA